MWYAVNRSRTRRFGVSVGDRIGLLGVNGAGKSTLVKALASGSTLLDGESVLSKDTKIGYFAQHQSELLRPEQLSKKQQRQEQALRRKRLKPMYDRVRDIEKQLADSRVELAGSERSAGSRRVAVRKPAMLAFNSRRDSDKQRAFFRSCLRS